MFLVHAIHQQVKGVFNGQTCKLVYPILSSLLDIIGRHCTAPVVHFGLEAVVTGRPSQAHEIAVQSFVQLSVEQGQQGRQGLPIPPLRIAWLWTLSE